MSTKSRVIPSILWTHSLICITVNESKNMNITIINDCRDANAAGRQVARAASLMKSSATFVGVKSDLEAAGSLVDILDAYGDSDGVVLVNVAPRHGKAKKWPNGTPFGYFWYKNILAVSSVDGLTLSLVKKLGLVDTINVMDIPTVMDKFVSENVLSKSLGEHIINTQFRSYDFLPRVAAYLLENKDVASEKYEIKNVDDAPSAVWWIDNFGNCKTTLLKKEIQEGSGISTSSGRINYFPRLKDVPDREKALVIGSSGLGDDRFLEIVVQGESAEKSLSLSSGDLVTLI